MKQAPDSSYGNCSSVQKQEIKKKLVLTNEAPTLTDFFLPSSAIAVKINLTTKRRGGKRQASTFFFRNAN